MIQITKDEKKIISEKFPYVYITRTMRGDSKRGHYYMEESKRAMALLKSIRGGAAYDSGTPAKRK